MSMGIGMGHGLLSHGLLSHGLRAMSHGVVSHTHCSKVKGRQVASRGLMEHFEGNPPRDFVSSGDPSEGRRRWDRTLAWIIALLLLLCPGFLFNLMMGVVVPERPAQLPSLGPALPILGSVRALNPQPAGPG